MVAVALALGLSSSAKAGSALFDFEDQATTTQDGLSTLALSNAGVNATLDRGGQTFGLLDISNQSGTSAFGARTLVPGTTGNNVFNVNFSQPISTVSLQYGDFGAKTDTLTLTAWSGPSGTGTLMGISQINLPAVPNTFTSQTLSLTTNGAQSVQFDGGAAGASGATDNSVYYDNLAVTTGSTGGGTTSVPLPAAAWTAPLGAALALLAAKRLRQRRVA